MNFQNEDCRIFHLSDKTKYDEWPYLNMHLTWNVFLNALAQAQQKFDVDLHAFVLMPNHYHLLVAPNKNNLSGFIKYLTTYVNESFESFSTAAPFAKNSYFIKRIPSFKVYQETYKYIYRNPAMDGYTRKVEDYYYSSLYQLLNNEQSIVVFEDNLNLFANCCRVLDWLNNLSEELYFKSH